ncbi:MAG TPA: iron-containing alcohol dehydrogenase [Chloroflexota bacterium]|nr:iron-containing alcohol dehydrogenase [Chloroflexota bacterium]
MTMDSGSFTYANPSVIHWGAGCVSERLGQALDTLGGQRVFVVTTASVARNPRLLGLIQQLLGSRLAGSFAQIGQHAPARDVVAATGAAREARPDVLLSIGGGSPIDASKAVAFSLVTGLDLTAPDAPARARELGARLGPSALPPHVAIPTTLSVAELSFLSGFSAEGTREKVGLRLPALLPATVLYDATLGLETPLDLWLSTGIRAVDHAVEAIIAAGQHPFSDTLALDGLRRLKGGLLATWADPADLAARTESQLGAWFSFTLPVAAAGGLSHTLGKRLGSPHGIPHGVSSCLLLPHVMRYLAPRTAPAQARIAEALGADVAGRSVEAAAPYAAAAVADLIAQLGLPRHLGAYKLTEEDLLEAVRPVASAEYPVADLLGILHAAW